MAHIELDQKIKQALPQWRENKYDGANPTTKRLLDFWFKEDHFLATGEKFEFWRCQREAIEALIYVYEGCKYTDLVSLFRGFGVSIPIPVIEDWPKYCFKMATGSGKTFVMAMAIVWQYFNKFFNTDNDLRYSSHFLLIAPNIIVMDRLNEAFKEGTIFKEFPFIPKEWMEDFDFQMILQSACLATHSKGILHLTNIQQLYDRPPKEAVNPVEGLLGESPPQEADLIYNTLLDQLVKYEDLFILNDEAHHVHSDDLEWNKVITNLHKNLKDKFKEGLVTQLDFSATPKDLKGVFFSHIIYDYPLAVAIKDKIVKRPYIGIIENVPLPTSKDFVKKNRIQIDTGVEILKRFQKEFKETSKKPVLFIMTDNTRNADRVGEYLEKDKRFKGKVLTIHTDVAGVITKKDLEKARAAARGIDNNEYQIIVSVMMLKEGWDVKNVCVIVPLRAFDSPILPEQTLGRGLRKMSFISEWDERLIVIDHPRFRDLWQAEIDKGELEADITTIKKAYQPSNRVMVDLSKLKFDIEIPVIEGGLSRIVPNLDELDIKKLPKKQFVLSDIKIPKIMYREKDLLTQKITEEKELAFDYTESYELYLAFITKAILAKIGAASQFHELVPKVKRYIETYLFDKKIDSTDKGIVKKLNDIFIREKIREAFVKALQGLSIKKEAFTFTRVFKISETPPFHTSEPVYRVKKTVFDFLPYSKKSHYEKEFMIYLDDKKEVLAYTRVLRGFPIRIPYHDREGYLRYYIPDFIVKAKDSILLVETKGAGFEEMVTTQIKAKSALEWCKAIFGLTKNKWIYVKILETDFLNYVGQSFSQMVKNLAAKTEKI